MSDIMERTGRVRVTNGVVARFIVHMNECTFNVGQNFNLVLQLLAEVVCFPKGGVFIHDNVNLDEVILIPSPVSGVH